MLLSSFLTFMFLLSQPGDCTVGDFGFQVSDHAEQINAPGPEVCTTNTMRVPGQDFTFEMSQFHIHVSSEHTLGGKVFGAELHAVHKARETDNLFAVLGFFIEPTATKNHPIFDQLLHELDELADEIGAECNQPTPLHWWQKERPDMKRMRANNHTYDHEALNVYDLIPEGSSFYNYDGGLTTPPCTEAVVWNVVDTPIAISPVQYTDLVALIVNHVDEHSCDYSTIADPFSGSTSRPTQPLNRRRVERICPEPVDEADNGKNDKNADDGEINVDDEEAAVVSRTGGDW